MTCLHRYRFLLHLGFTALLAGGAMQVHAIDYRSVSERAILYDVPSDRGKRLFIIAAGTPVEVVVALDKWTKVRDPGGSLLWIESNRLANKRTVQVTAARASIRQQPNENAPVAFEAVRDVVLDYLESSTAGWIKVRHTDGTTGYIRAGDIWGN